MSGDPVDLTSFSRQDNAIVVVQRGKVIGVLCEAAQENLRTLRLTFTRNNPTDHFSPLQGSPVEVFLDQNQPDDAAE